MDNIETQTSTDNLNNTQTESLEASPQQADEAVQTPETETKPYVPFSAGKEKFKINGKEEEYDWDTAKKYIQLGSTATQRMQEAAAEKKQVQKLYNDIVSLAQRDPEALLRALNPQYKSASNSAQTSAQPDGGTESQDPRDQELYQLKTDFAQAKEQLNQIFLEREQQALQSELDKTKEKYPAFQKKSNMTNLLVRYNQYLQSDVDISLEDVAFVVNKELEEETREEMAARQAKLTETRKRAPVSVKEATGGSKPKELTLEEYKKQYGVR